MGQAPCYWTVSVAAEQCWSHLGGGQDKGGKGAGHPARAEEVDDKPSEHLHGQDVAQQESEEGGLGLKQLHVLSRLAQGSEVLDQLGLPRWKGWSATEARARWSPGALSQCQSPGVQPEGQRGESTVLGSELGSRLVAKARPTKGVGRMRSRESQGGENP